MLNFFMKSSVSFLALTLFVTTDLSAMDPQKGRTTPAARASATTRVTEDFKGQASRLAAAGPDFDEEGEPTFDAANARKLKELWQDIYKFCKLKGKSYVKRCVDNLPSAIREACFRRGGVLSFSIHFDGAAFRRLYNDPERESDKEGLKALLVEQARLGEAEAREQLYENLSRNAVLAKRFLISGRNPEEAWPHPLRISNASLEELYQYYLLLAKSPHLENKKIRKANEAIGKKTKTRDEFLSEAFLTPDALQEFMIERSKVGDFYTARCISHAFENLQMLKRQEPENSILAQVTMPQLLEGHMLATVTAAQLGDPCCALELAMLLKGNMIRSTRSSATLRWLLAATQWEDAGAMCRVGVLLTDLANVIVANDHDRAYALYAEALKWNIRAIERGSIDAAVGAGNLLWITPFSAEPLLDFNSLLALYEGAGVSLPEGATDIPSNLRVVGDLAKALECHEMAAQRNHTFGILNTISILLYLDFVEERIDLLERARVWCDKIIHPEADLQIEPSQLADAKFRKAYILEKLSQKTGKYDKASYDEAFQLYQESADFVPDASACMGKILHEKLGTRSASPQEILDLFLKSAERGSARALVGAAHILQSSDPERALDLLYRAVQQKHTPAMSRLGIHLLRYGTSPSELKEGFFWIQEASKQQDKEAKEAKIFLAASTSTEESAESAEEDDGLLIHALERIDQIPDAMPPMPGNNLPYPAPSQKREESGAAASSAELIPVEPQPTAAAPAVAAAATATEMSRVAPGPTPKKTREGKTPTNAKLIREQLRESARLTAAAEAGRTVREVISLNPNSEKIIRMLFSSAHTGRVNRDHLIELSRDDYFAGQMTVRETTGGGTMVLLKNSLTGAYDSVSTHFNHDTANFRGFHRDFLKKLRQILVEIGNIPHRDMTE